MNLLSKMTPLFLAAALCFGTIGQFQYSSGYQQAFHQPDAGSSAPSLYLPGGGQSLWGLIYNDSSSSDPIPKPESDRDSKQPSAAAFPPELSLRPQDAVYLLFSRTTGRIPSVRDLLYPFHFYM